jgi:hypothetical protein
MSRGAISGSGDYRILHLSFLDAHLNKYGIWWVQAFIGVCPIFLHAGSSTSFIDICAFFGAPQSALLAAVSQVSRYLVSQRPFAALAMNHSWCGIFSDSV